MSLSVEYLLHIHKTLGSMASITVNRQAIKDSQTRHAWMAKPHYSSTVLSRWLYGLIFFTCDSYYLLVRLDL